MKPKESRGFKKIKLSNSMGSIERRYCKVFLGGDFLS